MLGKQPLRVQLSLIVGATVLFALLTFAFVLTLFELKMEDEFLASLSPAAQEAFYKDWEVEGMPAPELVEEVSIAEEVFYRDSYYQDQFMVALYISLGLVAAGTAVGIFLARRLAAPLEEVARSAARISDGDFSHRLETKANAPAEIRSLTASFAEMAAALNRMEQDLKYTSAATAHEIRTPLTIIQGYLQGMRDEVFEPTPERFDVLLKHIDGLGLLIDDLQTLSLADAGALALKFSKVNLEGEIEDAVTFVRGMEPSATININAAIASNLTVVADPARIRQVVIGLLKNACLYAGENVEIDVSLSADSDTIQLKVADSGAGFSDNALARGAERFWRGEKSRSRETGGSGLGLSVAHAIINAHGGTLTLSNHAQGGAVIDICLPTKPPEPPPKA